MIEAFFASPILNSPYEEPDRHWALDANGQPTTSIVPRRRPSALVSPIPKAKKTKDKPAEAQQAGLLVGGDGQTTVMAMLIVWQTVNAVRHSNSKKFSRGFLVVAPGITIKDRLRVLQPHDPESYYQSREIVPEDTIPPVYAAGERKRGGEVMKVVGG